MANYVVLADFEAFGREYHKGQHLTDTDFVLGFSADEVAKEIAKHRTATNIEIVPVVVAEPEPAPAPAAAPAHS